MGGEGYRRGNAAERAYRDAKGLTLAGTTVEVARMAIADALLSRP
jgi:alkylation response protein AidB-like acyl-CoA dehydrogenase